jgi:hypothetical protein
MKALLWAHGEKIFLCLVIVAGGWLLMGAAGSLTSSTSLSSKEKRDLDTMGTVNPPPAIPAMTQTDHLKQTFAGRSAPVKLSEGRMVYPQAMEVSVGPVEKEVMPRLPAPRGVSAAGDRGSVTVSWKPSQVFKAVVVRYEVLRADGTGAPKEVVGTVEPLRDPQKGVEEEKQSFTDLKVKAESAYAYAVRAVGKKKLATNEKLLDPKLPKSADGNWLSPVSAVSRAKTPSNLDFECTSISKVFGDKMRALIDVKRWNARAAKWDVFKTSPGIIEGNEVIGYRRKTITQRETIETGYVLRKVVDTTVDEEYEGEEYDPKTGEKVKVKKTRKKILQYIVLEHPGKNDTRKVFVRRAGTAPAEPRTEPGPKTTEPKPKRDESLIDRLRREMKERERGGN